MNPLLVIGRGGQLSNALESMELPDTVFVGMDTLDLSKPDNVRPVLEAYTPSAVLNAAAYTQVDLAEKEQDLAYAVNAESVRQIAIFCRARGIPLLHVSTDYVFDGTGDQPRDEATPAAPLNVYGQSKLAGELAIRDTGGEYLIFRTSWVFDHSGKNFVNTMLRLAAEHESLSVVDDQIGAPTYAPHLAQGMLKALRTAQAGAFASGVYHASAGGEVSWCGFAREIFATARHLGTTLKVKDVQPIASSAYPTPARRPLNSRLDCTKLERQLGVRLPDWKQGLRECLEKKYAAA
uniref:dTDP-4-dehydrorhamnose reductase n=1 Tax=uncultured bacterium CSL1 TaxID=1091565 RepID=G4WV97_9BACT|nr:dTDP-4-dehydrorhamnose reductase [uncultured bacterium CSL1]